jgi:hypothetical protein
MFYGVCLCRFNEYIVKLLLSVRCVLCDSDVVSVTRNLMTVV